VSLPHTNWWHWLAPFSGTFHTLLPYLVGGGALGSQPLLQKLRQRRAAAWPSADGAIQSVKVSQRNGRTVVTLEYRYYAQSEYRYGKYMRQFRRKQAAEQFAEAVRGRHIQVRYEPNKPQISVVLDDDLRLTGALQIG